MGAAIAALVLGSSARADEVEAVIGLDVDNPRAFVSAMDNMFESGAMDGYNLAVWANAFDGDNPATHTLVASFAGYESYQALTRQRLQHPGWLEYQHAVDGVSSVTATGMAVEAYRAGELVDSHRSAVAFVMTVRNPATYAAELANLTEAQGHPGSIRLMQMRYGGMGATHAVLLTAPDSVAMNEYLDKLLSSDDYAEFVEDVGAIRTIITVNNYSLVKRWRR